jgi:cytochrome c-type biogenesis protein CcmF
MTEIGTIGIWIVAGLAIAAFLTSLLSTRSKNTGWRRLANILHLLVVLLLVFLFCLLLFLFAINDVDMLYVWTRSSSDLALVYRLGSAWSGAGGSVLMMTLFMAVGSYCLANRISKGGATSEGFRARFLTFTSLVILGLTLILLLSDLFAPTVPSSEYAWRLDSFPDGHGMPISLQTWEMVLHPIVVFIAYALCLLVFASAAASLWKEERDWYRPSLLWARLAWFLLTLGIVIGAWWAYYEVGWGGYWSWDPVETISLVLWVVLTAYLHSVASLERTGHFRLFAPFLGIFSFVTVLLTMFVTRSGNLWLFAVHTYATAGSGGPEERFLSLLADDQALLTLFVLMLIVLAITVVLALRWRGRITSDVAEQGLSLDDRGLMLATLVVLLVIGILITLILFKNLDSDIVQNYDELTQKVPLFFSMLMLVMILCLAWRSLGMVRALFLLGFISVISIVAAIFAWSIGSGPFLYFPIPIFLASSLVAAVYLWKRLSLRPIRTALNAAAPHLIHLGVAFVLLAYVCSTGFQSVPAAGNPVSLAPGEGLDVSGFDITVVDIEISDAVPSPSHNYNQVWTVTLDITKDGKDVSKGVHLENFYLVNETEVRKVKGEVGVVKTLGEDLYLEFDQGDDDQVAISATLIPLMNLLWAGSALLMLGVGLRALFWTGTQKTGQST